MKTITVRDDFPGLKDFTENLPNTFDLQGRVIHNGRNVIKRIDTGDGKFVVKDFRGMYLFNRLAYSLFRPSKAARSYRYSEILNNKGILTPPHVAWIDCYTLGLLRRSYFVSVFFPYKTLGEAIKYYEIYDDSYKQSLLGHLAAFVHRLHRLGVYHKDLSPGNILVIPNVDGFDFALVDLNRIQFRKVKFDDGLRNFVTLGIEREDLNIVLTEYAKRFEQVTESALRAFWKYKDRKSNYYRLRRKLRRYTLTPLETLFRPSHA